MINPTIFSGKVIGARRAMGAYSAIVKVQETDVWAEDEYGKTIADGEAGVDDASVLQSALNNISSSGGAVWIADVLTLTAKVTVPANVVLIGRGSYDIENDKIMGSGLKGNLTTPLLEITGKEVIIEGLAIVNYNAAGDGILVSAKIPFIRFCDIYTKRYGIHLNPTTTAVEPKICWNRLSSGESGAAAYSGSIGIYIQNMTDAEIHHNIIRGYETSIKIDKESATIAFNHTYKYPADSIQKGILVTASGVEMYNNFIEGRPTVGIEIQKYRTKIINNTIWVKGGTGSYGIHINYSSSVNMSRCTIKDNEIEGELTQNADTAIKTTNVSGLYKTEISGNQIRYFDNAGLIACKFLEPQSSVPSAAVAGQWYLDDGTNTADGNPHFRYYDGASWRDL